MMAIANPSLRITTIERDQTRYLEALKKDYVNKPMAYALYEVWKVWDEKYNK